MSFQLKVANIFTKEVTHCQFCSSMRNSFNTIQCILFGKYVARFYLNGHAVRILLLTRGNLIPVDEISLYMLDEYLKIGHSEHVECIMCSMHSTCSLQIVFRYFSSIDSDNVTTVQYLILDSNALSRKINCFEWRTFRKIQPLQVVILSFYPFSRLSFRLVAYLLIFFLLFLMFYVCILFSF